MNSQKKMALEQESATEQTNAGDTNKQNWTFELLKRTEIEGTMFEAVTTEHGTKVVWGQYPLSEWFDTEEEAIESGKKVEWEGLMAVLNIVLTEYDKKLHEVNEILKK